MLGSVAGRFTLCMGPESESSKLLDHKSWGGGGVAQKNKQLPVKSFYVLLPYIIYVMPSGRFSHCPAFLSRTAKQRDKKYIVKSPQLYKK